jgi:NADH-quinone oxidoreductase subunit L
MKITAITCWIGTLALIGTPLFSGFYSKDMIVEAAKFSEIPGSGFAYFAVLAGVFVTAFYSFRMYFLVFHGAPRWGRAQHAAHGHGDDAHDAEDAHDDHGDHSEHHGLQAGDRPHESPWVVTLPLVLLAIPSVIVGYLAIEPLLFGDYFGNAIHVDHAAHPAMNELAQHFHGAAALALHALTTPTFLLALAGVVLSWFFYLRRPDIPAALKARFSGLYRILENKYGFDSFNERVFAGGARRIGGRLWQIGDVKLIDGFFVNGTARLIGRLSTVVRLLQSGLIYHYAFAMIIGVFLLLTFFMKA